MNQRAFDLAPPAGAFLGAELVLATVLVLGLLSLAIPLGQKSMDKARFSELLMHAPVARMELAVEHAVTGRWADEIPALEPGGVMLEAHSLDHANGSFVIAFNSSDRPAGHLAFDLIEGEHATLIWRCGYSAPPFGTPVPAPIPTSVPPELLPAACRLPARP
ncbi:MAG: hypothetical protein ACXIUM_01805 [Wenzhouxiangella sp.]